MKFEVRVARYGARVYSGRVNEIRVVLGKGGRINIPAEHRRALGLSDGDEVLVGIEDGAIRIRTREAAIERARHIVRRYVPEGTSLVEELSRERREEARAEDLKAARRVVRG